MKTHPHRAVDLPASPPSRRAGKCRFAVLAGVLAALMLSTTTAVAAPTPNLAWAAKPSNVPLGTFVTFLPHYVFNNAGTNSRWSTATFSNPEYFDDSTGIQSSAKSIWIKLKTTAELNALDPLPPEPMTSTVTVTMTNDEGQTATTTVNLQTLYWGRIEPPSGPTLSVTSQDAPPDVSASGYASYFFSNAGAGARLTDVSFSTMEYYNADRTGLSGAYLFVTAKTSEELNAMDSPPPNPFTVQVTLTMTNNASQTATGTVDYVTSY